MRNIIGQTKSGFNLRDIMDNNKILLVNLSKGKMGELNSKLLGIIFVMKFQAAAMGRADIPEQDRVDFSLYVDEFQNFATESFESILSEARKYRLNLILGNQFITQLTDKIREAIIGNVGTIISGRIGVTDAELLEKAFRPTFDEDDLTKLPNYHAITTVQINGVPSAPFSMSFVPPMGQTNSQLRDALKRLSAAKYGKPRADVEKEIFGRLGAADAEKKAKLEALKKAQQERMMGMNNTPSTSPTGGSSFLDEWLAKRQQMNSQPASSTKPSAPASQMSVSTVPQAAMSPPVPTVPPQQPQAQVPPTVPPAAPQQPPQVPTVDLNHLQIRTDDKVKSSDDEVVFKIR
jgi:hypothetical protein